MSVDYAVKYYQRLRGRAGSFANRVHREQWSCDFARKVWFEAVCAGPDYKRAPRWIQDRMSGWYECFIDEMWRRHTAWHVWCGVQNKHVRTRTHGGSEEPIDWSQVDADKGASIWIPSGKVWSGYDPTGEAAKVPTADQLELMRLTWG
jgi:hypothetical protein